MMCAFQPLRRLHRLHTDQSFHFPQNDFHVSGGQQFFQVTPACLQTYEEMFLVLTVALIEMTKRVQFR